MEKMKTLTLNNTTFEIVDEQARMTQADFMQNDSAASDHIKNRICYENIEQKYEPVNISWDGTSYDDLIRIKNAITFKISDTIITSEEDIKKLTITYDNGTVMNIGAIWDGMISRGMFEFVEGSHFIGPIAIAFKDGVILEKDGEVIGEYPERGIYCSGPMTITSTEPVLQTIITTKKIDKKWIPIDRKGCFILNFTWNSTLNKYICGTDKNLIIGAYRNGEKIMAKTPDGQYPLTYISIDEDDNLKCSFSGVNSFSEATPYLACYNYDNGDITYNKYSLTAIEE